MKRLSVCLNIWVMSTVLTNEDRERIKDQYDIYDLIEVLDLSIEEFIDVFDFKLIDCHEVMEKISGSFLVEPDDEYGTS